MNTNTLSTAIAEAERFLKVAKELRDDPYASADAELTGCWITGSRLSGATRRASMDLTRALSDLRRPM
jgi:hypothetical protein